MLELLALLQTRQHWKGEDLARRLEVSRRTLRRDVDRLRDLGYPVESTRGLDGGYQLGPGGRLPPLLLSSEEAVASVVGLRIAADQPIGGITDAAIGALIKITQLLPPRLRSQAEAVATAVTTPSGRYDDVTLDTLTMLARTSRDNEGLRFTYRTHLGVDGDRHVDPHHVVPLGRRWYLVAWDIDRSDWRIFRLDRITNPRPTGRRFDPRELPGTDPGSYVSRSIASIATTYHVEVVVRVPVRAAREAVGPLGRATAERPGVTRIEMDVDDLSWAVMVLATLDTPIESVEPPELRTLLQRLADQFRPTDDTVAS